MVITFTSLKCEFQNIDKRESEKKILYCNVSGGEISNDRLSVRRTDSWHMYSKDKIFPLSILCLASYREFLKVLEKLPPHTYLGKGAQN